MPSLYILIALGLTIVGILLLTGVWRLSLNGLDGIGLLFALLATAMYIAYLVLGRRVGRDVPALTTTSFGALVAGIFLLLVQPAWTFSSRTWTPHHLLF